MPSAAVPLSPVRAQRWPCPAVVPASIGVHLAAGAAALLWPAAAAWALGAVALNHTMLGVAGLLPRSRLLGPNLDRLPPGPGSAHAVALTFDDGPDPALTPRVLDLLDAEGARATFFCAAGRARRHPALVREIVRRGHSVQNRSRLRPHRFSLLGPRGFAQEIGAAQALLADLTGALPHCFRAPAGLRNPLLDPVLHELDLHLVSWTRRALDTCDGDATRVFGRLAEDLAAGDILQMHDGRCRRTAHGAPVVLQVLPPLLAHCRANGLATVTLGDAVGRRSAAEPHA